MKNSAHGDSSTGSELKAVEEACREVLERSNHANSASLRCDLLRGHPIFLCTPANHGAHVARRAGFGQGRLEDLMNLWVLVFVFDLISTLLHVHLDGLFVGECDKSVALAIPF